MNETKLGLVDPKDVVVLASYRRAISRQLYRDEDRFEQVQIRVRQHLLKTLGCKIVDIEKILQWEWIPRDKCGFRLAGQPLKVPIPANGKVYAAVEGISFYANGSFYLNLIEADENNALFNSDDVDLIMKQGITGASFSLDPPSDLPHPFQKATWVPYDALNGTDFLATMLHADLLLKSMNFLAETSAKSPFRTRSIRDGAYLALSEDLYQQLFKESRAEYGRISSSVRMWIESEPIKYNIIEHDGSITYRFGPSNMQIKYENRLEYDVEYGTIIGARI
ncbi:unnamed protein product [Rotaria sp. Silwood2]|nr:unnamed protein product [Rotaria sp. Silwood2]CAF3459222.1 unnamed protein product [Rotaria sp. Silwood2]CAF4534792.1 unnamed protein product [Rotaria sp. Silwood2]CAF4554810.1 unnamed protein product [Rotaria sp. Silwood2]